MHVVECEIYAVRDLSSTPLGVCPPEWRALFATGGFSCVPFLRHGLTRGASSQTEFVQEFLGLDRPPEGVSLRTCFWNSVVVQNGRLGMLSVRNVQWKMSEKGDLYSLGDKNFAHYDIYIWTDSGELSKTYLFLLDKDTERIQGYINQEFGSKKDWAPCDFRKNDLSFSSIPVDPDVVALINSTLFGSLKPVGKSLQGIAGLYIRPPILIESLFNFKHADRLYQGLSWEEGVYEFGGVQLTIETDEAFLSDTERKLCVKNDGRLSGEPLASSNWAQNLFLISLVLMRPSADIKISGADLLAKSIGLPGAAVQEVLVSVALLVKTVSLNFTRTLPTWKHLLLGGEYPQCDVCCQRKRLFAGVCASCVTQTKTVSAFFRPKDIEDAGFELVNPTLLFEKCQEEQTRSWVKPYLKPNWGEELLSHRNHASMTWFYHHSCGGEADDGWGAGYRAIQMVASNLHERRAWNHGVPSILDIQQTCDTILRRGGHTGLNSPIARTDAQLNPHNVLEYFRYLGIGGRCETQTLTPEILEPILVNHFGTYKTPVVVSDETFTFCVVAIRRREYLIFNPYVSQDEVTRLSTFEIKSKTRRVSIKDTADSKEEIKGLTSIPLPSTANGDDLSVAERTESRDVMYAAAASEFEKQASDARELERRQLRGEELQKIQKSYVNWYSFERFFQNKRWVLYFAEPNVVH